MVELKVKLGPKGQIVIPKIFREEYKIFPNEEVIIEESTEGIIIKKKSEDPIELLRRISKEASKKRKGRSLRIDPHEIYEQYNKRLKRAGIK